MASKLSEGVKQGMTEKQAWDTFAGISLCEAGIAHSIFTVHTFYINFVQTIQEPNLKTVMTKLCVLYGLEKIIERASRVYESGILAPEAFQLINEKREALLAEIRPEALTLVEAFEYSDNTLQSAIAHSNERPYENLIHWARNYNTVNRPEERKQVIEALNKAKAQLRPKL
jgi:acyl-CoA oxidase